MLEVKNLVKKYSGKTAIDNITFSVDKGDILGFLGLNGAGKSTTMNIITGYISSTSGSVLINGKDILYEPLEAKKHIGYLPEIPPVYNDMTVLEYLQFVSELKNVKRENRKLHIKEICEKVHIDHIKNRIIKSLSKGYKQRVGIAQALIGDPDILIFDEPTVGLDPKQIIEIRSLIKELGESHTVILSSHILSEIQEVCNRIIIINKGVIVEDDLTTNLSNDENKFLFAISGNLDEIESTLKSVEKVQKVTFQREVEPSVYEFEVEANSGDDIRKDVFSVLADKRMPIMSLRNVSSTLEDIFLKLTDDQMKDLSEGDSAVNDLDEETASDQVSMESDAVDESVGEVDDGSDMESKDEVIDSIDVATPDNGNFTNQEVNE